MALVRVVQVWRTPEKFEKWYGSVEGARSGGRALIGARGMNYKMLAILPRDVIPAWYIFCHHVRLSPSVTAVTGYLSKLVFGKG